MRRTPPGAGQQKRASGTRKQAPGSTQPCVSVPRPSIAPNRQIVTQPLCVSLIEIARSGWMTRNAGAGQHQMRTN